MKLEQLLSTKPEDVKQNKLLLCELMVASRVQEHVLEYLASKLTTRKIENIPLQNVYELSRYLYENYAEFTTFVHYFAIRYDLQIENILLIIQHYKPNEFQKWTIDHMPSGIWKNAYFLFNSMYPVIIEKDYE